jgi:hypothetical protein
MRINTFYKYKAINKYTLDSLKNKYFYYSRQEQLDDPFDMYTPVDTLKTDEEIKELFRRDPETAALHTIDSYKKRQKASETDERYHSKFLEVNQMFHVLCLTPIYDNDAMWALYADNYKGIAIGYKANVDNNYYISLGTKRPIINQRQFLLKQEKERFYENPDLRIVLNPVIYDISKLKKFNPLMSDPNEMLENIYIKKSLWSFEKEYRSVIISPWHRYEDLKIYYPDNVITEIIFGYKTSEEDIKIVIELIRNNYENFSKIKFYKAVPNRNKFFIEKKTLKIIK